MSEPHFVVSIAREYNAGGRSVARLLAQRLGVEYYDRDLLRFASDASGIHEALFGKADENVARAHLLRAVRKVYNGEVLPPESDDFLSQRNLFNYQAKVIKELAQAESCIIIGRCSDFVLKDMPHVLRVFLHAPTPLRVDREVQTSPPAGRRELERRIQSIDKRRADYYHCYTGRDWRDARHYDLSLNTGSTAYARCVELICGYLKLRGDL